MVSKGIISRQPTLIFVTVGTTKFDFRRLFIAIDRVVSKSFYQSVIFVQQGESTYKWSYKKVKKYKHLSPKKMKILIKKADRIICHAGCGSLYEISTTTKVTPLSVARLKKYNEHVNNHQKQFIKYLRQKIPNQYSNLFVEKSSIESYILNYLKMKNVKNELLKYIFNKGNTIYFNKQFSKIIKNI